ncbi:hypothetical protein [Capnocytophaga cynodegmi]|uniref:hypothetical protein n=1 Tax=Capnocytophaga cynodegmi TaxID=28189 RepID=UPI00036F8DDB|nr:hypothetical protein [Capnocytophaga cynodegmi]CEN37551.1 hypothetical protein CCYN49044_20181 [Capnocytophaga cynodegmi]
MYRNDFLINELENTLYELRDIMYNKLFQKDFVDLEKSIEIVKQKHINQLYIVDIKIQNFVRLLYETGILRDIDNEVYDIIIRHIGRINYLIKNIIENQHDT